MGRLLNFSSEEILRLAGRVPEWEHKCFDKYWGNHEDLSIWLDLDRRLWLGRIIGMHVTFIHNPEEGVHRYMGEADVYSPAAISFAEYVHNEFNPGLRESRKEGRERVRASIKTKREVRSRPKRWAVNAYNTP